jgi:hypothetical protein
MFSFRSISISHGSHLVTYWRINDSHGHFRLLFLLHKAKCFDPAKSMDDRQISLDGQDQPSLEGRLAAQAGFEFPGPGPGCGLGAGERWAPVRPWAFFRWWAELTRTVRVWVAGFYFVWAARCCSAMGRGRIFFQTGPSANVVRLLGQKRMVCVRNWPWAVSAARPLSSLMNSKDLVLIFQKHVYWYDVLNLCQIFEPTG